MQPRDNTKDLIDLLGGNKETAPDLPCGWGWYSQQAFDYGYHVTAAGDGDGVRLTTRAERQARLFEADGTPKEVLIFDNDGRTWDRYSVFFTGPNIHLMNGDSLYVGMSANPFSPQGFGQHGSQRGMIEKGDAHCYEHLGRRIEFRELPEACRRLVMEDYCELWDVEEPDAKA